MPLLQRGELVGEGQQQDRYKVRRKVGEGQFSEVYEVEDTTGGGLYALKIERSPDVRTVRQECKTLRRLQQCAQICKARGSGTYGDRFYMVLDLLGNNLVEARRSVQGSRLDLSTAKHVALSLLVPLEAMHREGFIHRDVKPANYAIYPPGAASTEGQWTLIDFGLARRYVDDEGKLLPERTDASFRGSSTYASAQVMEHRDQGRRDDLWSWLYVVVELIAGTLPWRFDGEGGEKPNREAVLQLKQSCMAAPRQLVGTTPCPQAIVELSSYLRGLQFDAEPDYDWVRSLVSRLDEEPLSGVSDEAQPMAVDQAPRQQEQQQQQKEQYQQQHQPGGPSCDLPLAGQGSGGELGAGVAVPVAAWGASTLPSRPAESPPPPLPLPPPPALGSPLPLMLDLEGILTMPGWSGGQSDAAALGSQQAGGQPNGTLEAVPALQLQATVEQRSQKLPGLEPALGKQGSGLTLCLPAGAPANEPELSSGAAAAADDGDAPAHGLARAIRASGAAEPAAAPFEAMPAQQQQQPLEKARLPEGGGVPSMPRRRGMQEAQQQAGQAGLRATDEAGVGGREARRAPQLEQHPQQERPREGLSKPPRSRPSSAAAAGSSAAARAAPEKTGGKGHAGHAPSGMNGAVAPAAPAVADAAAGTGGGGGVSKRGVKEGTAQGSQPDKGKRTGRIVAGSGSRASGGAADGSGRDGRQGRGQSGERLKDTRPPSSSQQQQQRPQPWHRGSSRSRSRSRSPRSPSLSPSRSRSESYHRQQQHQRKRRRSYSRSPSSSRSRSRSRSHSRRRSDRSRDRDRDRDMDRSRSRDRDRDSRDRSRSRERERDRRERRDRRGNRSRSRSRTRYRSRSRERPEAAIKGRPQDTSAHLNDPIVKRYREMLDYVFALKQGGISPAGEKACRQLRALAPAEALGAICWVLDDVGSQATAKQSQLAAQLLEDVSAFAAGLARKCVELQEARP